MEKQEIMNLTPEEVDNELFRELTQWEHKDLVNHIIGTMNKNNKRNWILSYFEQD